MDLKFHADKVIPYNNYKSNFRHLCIRALYIYKSLHLHIYIFCIYMSKFIIFREYIAYCFANRVDLFRTYNYVDINCKFQDWYSSK